MNLVILSIALTLIGVFMPMYQTILKPFAPYFLCIGITLLVVSLLVLVFYKGAYPRWINIKTVGSLILIECVVFLCFQGLCKEKISLTGVSGWWFIALGALLMLIASVGIIWLLYYQEKENWLYMKQKKEALRVAIPIQQVDLVETLAMIFESSDEITGGRAAELMDRITHLLKCRKACIQHKLMREVMGLDNKPFNPTAKSRGGLIQSLYS